MQQATKAFPIRAPVQIRSGVDDAFGGLAKNIGAAEGQNAPDHIRQSDLISRQRRLAVRAPDLLIRIGVERVAHLRETRARIGAILIRGVLGAEIIPAHEYRRIAIEKSQRISSAVAFKSPRNGCGKRSGPAARPSLYSMVVGSTVESRWLTRRGAPRRRAC